MCHQIRKFKFLFDFNDIRSGDVNPTVGERRNIVLVNRVSDRGIRTKEGSIAESNGSTEGLACRKMIIFKRERIQ